jgi:DNA (cytosine-5)-methyltransferase 1
MKALDLFCCAGGVSVGLQRAGFDVTGVDIHPQPRYRGGVFVQGDALTYPLDGFDFIWASPPCQRWCAATVMRGLGAKEAHPDLLAPMRERLAAAGTPYVIENVVGAPLRHPVMVCGLALGIRVKRHRLFESPLLLMGTECPKGHPGEWWTVVGNGGKRTRPRSAGPELRRAAMGIDWMNRYELSQAIPPAYAEFLGRQVIAVLKRSA